jgi:hypothetical protein
LCGAGEAMNEEMDANGRVTLAILKAEIVLDDAIRAWEEVERAEAAVAKEEMDAILGAAGDCDENDFLPFLLAQRGVGSAGVVLRVLRTLRGREP